MNKFIITLLCLSIAGTAFSQYFSPGVEMYSKKKTCYLTLNSGDEVEGTLKKLSRKKGLFEEITLIINDEKVEFLAEDIASMYLPQSGLDKMNKSFDKMYDATQWESEDLNEEHLKDGYAYFEQSAIQLKKKQVTVLLQLVNPAFKNQVKVYFDPYAKESASASIGGIKVAGGIDKSYWVKVGDDVAYKLQKKNYEDELDNVYRTCSDFAGTIEKVKWADFGEHLYNYSKSCKN